MALNFFDYNQLTRGTYEGDQHDRVPKSSQDTRQQPEEDNKGTNLRIRVPELRKLHSESTLRAHARRPASPLSPRSPHTPQTTRQTYGSRPATAGAGRQDNRAGPSTSQPGQKDKRPDTALSRRTEASDERAARRQSFNRALHNLVPLYRSKSKTRDRKSHGQSPELPLPKTSGQDTGRDEEDSRAKPSKENDHSTEPRPQRSRANTMRNKATNFLQQLTNLTASKPPDPVDRSAVPTTTPVLSLEQSKFLAESLAHVTVGEWLFKDHNRPSIVPRSNPFRRQTGPPARGSTGLPQKRWFRISPYDRKVMWSSKWDASSLDQLKTSRQVPVDIVFETSANALFVDCLPTHQIPFKRSIVIVAPQRIVKITAPDHERHTLWLTALRYIANSTVKLNEESWAAELRARFEVLSTTQLATAFEPVVVSGALAHGEQQDAQQKRKHPSNLVAEKPLPPSPPRSTYSRTTGTPAITPPTVPRYSKHGKQRSEGVSTMADSDFRLPSRGSDDEKVPALNLPLDITGEPQSLDIGREQPAASQRSSVRVVQDEEMVERIEEERSQPERGPDVETVTHAEGSQRDSRRLTSDDFAVDQMEMLVDRLGKI